MLQHVNIRDFVTLDTVQLDFTPGTTVITGETGTGKSILLTAIELALGARGADHFIRQGAERADISLTFDIHAFPSAKAWLQARDLTTNECILRRVIARQGRSRCYINGTPVPLSDLRALGEHFIQLHGQHAQQALLQADTPLSLLDEFAGHPELQKNVRHHAETLHQLQRDITTKQTLREKNAAQHAWLQFQLNECEQLHLQPDELIQLDTEHRQLAHANTLIQQIAHIQATLTEHEPSARSLVSHACHQLDTLQQTDPSIASLTQRLKNNLIDLDDIVTELHHYAEKIEENPTRLAEVEARLSALFSLARKYKIAPEDLFSFQENLTAQLQQEKNSDSEIAALTEKMTIVQENYTQAAHALSVSRQHAAEKLSACITETLHQLALPHAEFACQLIPRQTPFATDGAEKAVFLMKTNKNQPLQPIQTALSGGELSRLSLALCAATGIRRTVPTLIFDEVDAGIGGGTAEMVGRLLRQLGEQRGDNQPAIAAHYQVICVTHAPQVASQGHHHLRIEKRQETEETLTRIKLLSAEESIMEIARMLGGVELTEKTLAHAREMREQFILRTEEMI